MNKTFTLLMAAVLLLFGNIAWAQSRANVTDVLTRELTGVTGTSYVSWSNVTINSNAVYAGQSAGGNEAIQLRSNNNNSGIITTASGGTVASISVAWNSNTAAGRTLNVYGSNTPYTSPTELYNANTQGTLLGTIVMGTNTELLVDDAYEYIGMRSNSGAMYLDTISVTWTAGSGPSVAMPTFSPEGGTYTEAQTVSISCATSGTTIYYTTDGSTPDDESNVYSSPITVSETTTIKAIAYDAHDNTSHVSSATYTIISPAEMLTFTRINGHAAEEGKTYLIVDLTSGRALTAANGSTGAPTAIEVSIDENNQIFTNDTDLQWTFESTDNGYVIHSVTNSESCLYTTANNNGVRVGSSDNKYWQLNITDDANPNYHGLFNTVTSRYIGVYENQDWRCYTSINNNIKNSKIELFVLGDQPYQEEPAINANDVEIDYNVTTGSIAYTIDNAVTGGSLTASLTEGDWLTLGNVNSNAVPFTTTANASAASRTATVTLTYTYNRSTVTKTVTVTQAGNPNTTNTISEITAAGNYIVEGTIVAKSKRGFIVGDGTGYVYYYNTSYNQSDYAIGDMVKLDGPVVIYGGVFEFNNTTEVTAAESSNYTADEPTVITGQDMDTRVASATPAQLSNYVQYEGTLSVSGTHYNITDIEGATTAIGSISFPMDTAFTAFDGITVRVKGYYVGISSSTYYNTMIGSIEQIGTVHPVIVADDITIPYNAAGGEIAYTVNHAVEGSSLTATTTTSWISHLTVNESTVTFTTTMNNDEADRTGTIILSYPGADNKTVTVTQSHYVVDYAELPFFFDGGKADIDTVAGLTQIGLGNDYSNSPKLKFDGTDDCLILKFNEEPGKLEFDIKGNTFTEGTFTVQTSIDGETYTDLESFTELSGSATTMTYDSLSSSIRFIKWIFTEKVNGNVGIGNIKLYQPSVGPVVTLNTISEITEEGDYTIQGTIVAKSTRGFIVGDGTGYAYYFNQNYAHSDYAIGDMVRLEGQVVTYGGVFEFNSSATVTTAESSNYTTDEPTVITGEEMDERVSSATPAQLSNYVQYEGTLSVSGTHYNITDIEGATTAIGSISYPIDTDFSSMNGSTVRVKGYFVGISSNTYYNTMIGSIEELEPPTPIEINPTHTLATSIESGRHYIVVGQKGAETYAMGSQSNNNRSAVAVTLGDGAVEVDPEAGVYEFVINGPDANGNYTIYDTNEASTGYLYAANSNSNYLKTRAYNTDGNSQWSITFGENNVANIIAQGSNTHNHLRFNTSSGLFSCYAETSTMAEVFLYVKAEEEYYEFVSDINGYGEENNHWQLIASPVAAQTNPQNVVNMQANEYDLYRFNLANEGEEWRNYKAQSFNLTKGAGYLYANSGNTTLRFVGQPNTNGNVSLTYTTTQNSEHNGWNLIGNPLGQAAYLSDGRSFYVMNEEGTEIILSETNVVNAMQGIFVKAQNANDQTITFTTTPNKAQSITIDLSSDNQLIDRATVRFDNEERLEKLSIQDNHSQIFFSDENQKYAVVDAKSSNEIPIGLKTEKDTEYTLNIHVNNVSIAYLHLIDKLTGDEIDLTQEPSYSFKASSQEPSERFLIIFSEKK